MSVAPTAKGARPRHLPQPLERARFMSVRRRWPHQAWMADGRPRHDWEATAFLLLPLLATLLAASLFDAVVLYGWRSAGDVLARWPGPMALAVVLLVNASLLERALRRHTPARLHPTRLVLWVRRVIAAVPIVGLLALPAWRRLVAQRPRWACATAGAPQLSLTARVQPPRVWRRVERWVDARAQSLLWLGLWAVSCQVLPALALIQASVDAAAAPGVPWAWPATLGLALHATAALLAASYTALQLRRHPTGAGRTWLLRAIGLAPLLPLPGCLPTLLTWAWLDRENPERRAIVALPWRRRGLQGVPTALQAGTLRGMRALGMARDERARRSFYRLKAAALVVDVGALAWLYERFVGEVPGTRDVGDWRLSLALLGLWLLALGAWRLHGFLRARRTARLTPVPPLARFLGLSGVAALVGVWLGAWSARGDSFALAQALTALGLLAVIVTMFSGVLAELKDQAVRTWPTFTAWLLLYGALLYAGLPGLVGPLAPFWRPALVHGCEIAFAAAPLVSLLLFVAFGRSVLQPFRAHAVIDATLHCRARAAVGVVALTALLPLGGLAVPAWIYLRQRHWSHLARAHLARRPRWRAS